MEMHQVRYFLAVSQTMNFTRAAEQCHVAQPSLTRAIKLLEEELGDDLFRRERKLTHLTDFGHRMLPFLRQCFESAQTAKTIAKTIRSGALAPLSLALSRSVDLVVLAPVLSDLARNCPGLALKFLRGSAAEVSEFLKKGEAEIAVAGPIEEKWERLDSWPLFSERFMSQDHRLAKLDSIETANLGGERVLLRPYCENYRTAAQFLFPESPVQGMHELAGDDDVMKMIEAGLGVGILPESTASPASLHRKAVRDMTLERTVYMYNVAGRGRSPAGATLMKSLRARDWAATAH